MISQPCCLQTQGFCGHSGAALTQNVIKRSLSYQKNHTNIVRMKIPTEMRNHEDWDLRIFLFLSYKIAVSSNADCETA